VDLIGRRRVINHVPKLRCCVAKMAAKLERALKGPVGAELSLPESDLSAADAKKVADVVTAKKLVVVDLRGAEWPLPHPLTTHYYRHHRARARPAPRDREPPARRLRSKQYRRRGLRCHRKRRQIEQVCHATESRWRGAAVHVWQRGLFGRPPGRELAPHVW
jgi:hypothetical protein